MDLNTTTPARSNTSSARYATAILVAVGIQVAALAAAYGAIAQIAIDFSSFTGRPEEDTSTWKFSAFAIGALVLWVASGAAAARITGERAAWITLLIAPTAVGLYLIVAG